MINNVLKNKYILASQSPRRQELLRMLGLDFEVRSKNIEETYPNNLPLTEIPIYLSQKKAKSISSDVAEKAIIIAADTIVTIDEKILEKPIDRSDAQKMLEMLSEKQHKVVSGVTIMQGDNMKSFNEITKVTFKSLSSEEIYYYIDKYKPYDKAGSYAIQEWIGMIGVKRLEGCYYNVVGLPIHKLYKTLLTI